MRSPATKPRGRSLRRYALPALVASAGCFPSLSLGSWSWDSSSSPGCEWGDASPVAPDNFRYVCPGSGATPEGGVEEAEAGDGGALAFPVPPGSDDIACVLGLGSNGGLPTVAIGAPFALEYVLTEDASTTVLAPQPAAGSLVEMGPEGFSAHLGFTPFLVWQGPDVLDYTLASARPVASIGFLWDPYGPDAGSSFPLWSALVLEQRLAADGGAAPPYPATVGTTFILVAVPQAIDGSLLAGRASCSFTSSDTRLLTVTGQGIVAQLTPLAQGEVRLTATCMGAKGEAEVVIGLPTDAGEPGDGPGDDVSPEATTDASSDAYMDGGAASDSGSVADGEGG